MVRHKLRSFYWDFDARTEGGSYEEKFESEHI